MVRVQKKKKKTCSHAHLSPSPDEPYANIFLFGKMVEASALVAYNRKQLDEFFRISNPKSKEYQYYLSHVDYAAMTRVFSELCNEGRFRCKCAPFVRERV